MMVVDDQLHEARRNEIWKQATISAGRTSRTATSLAIYLALMAYLVVVKIVIDLGSIDAVVPGQASAFTWPVIGFLALAGGCSVWLAPRTGLPELWDPSRRWLLFTALVGLGLGAVNLTVQTLIGFADTLAQAANVPSLNVGFPASILFYSGGAIIVEALFRLIIITLPVWLIANVILRKRGQATVFWIVAVLTSLLEPWTQVSLVLGHADVMLILGVATYALNLFEAFLFWRYGFLAPVVFRVCFYLVWHVIGGVMGL